MFREGRLTYFLAFLAGAGLNLSFAPFEIFLLLILTLGGFYQLLEGAKTAKQAAKISFVFGFGFYLCGLFWIANSFFERGGAFVYMAPIAVIGLPLILALYFVALGCLYFKIKQYSSFFRPIIFALLWTVMEYAKAHILTGFPWNMLAYTALAKIQIAQAAYYIGPYLLSGVICLITIIPDYIINNYKHRSTLWFYIILQLCMAVSLLWGGAKHIENTTSQNYKVAVVQPNIAQADKLNPNRKVHIFAQTINALKQVKPDAELVILPEAAIPYFLDKNANIRNELVKHVPNNSHLIVGGLRYEGKNYNSLKMYNSLFIINKKAQIVAIYDKNHLVPFGEYVPLSNILPIQKLTAGMTDFEAGKPTNNLQAGGINIKPLICYEVIFSELANNSNSDVIVNITNDAWFGRTIGPHQHLAAAKMRAIENRKILYRSANTGISAIINPNGVVEKSLPTGAFGVIQ